MNELNKPIETVTDESICSKISAKCGSYQVGIWFLFIRGFFNYVLDNNTKDHNAF